MQRGRPFLRAENPRYPDLVPATVAARFSLLAEPSPGLLPRVMQPFAKRDLVPDHFASHREDGTLRLSFVTATVEQINTGMAEKVRFTS